MSVARRSGATLPPPPPADAPGAWRWIPTLCRPGHSVCGGDPLQVILARKSTWHFPAPPTRRHQLALSAVGDRSRCRQWWMLFRTSASGWWCCSSLVPRSQRWRLTLPMSGFFQISLAVFWLMAFSSATHDIACRWLYHAGLPQKTQAAFVGVHPRFNIARQHRRAGWPVWIAGTSRAHGQCRHCLELIVRRVGRYSCWRDVGAPSAAAPAEEDAGAGPTCSRLAGAGLHRRLRPVSLPRHHRGDLGFLLTLPLPRGAAARAGHAVLAGPHRAKAASGSRPRRSGLRHRRAPSADAWVACWAAGSSPGGLKRCGRWWRPCMPNLAFLTFSPWPPAGLVVVSQPAGARAGSATASAFTAYLPWP